MSSGDLDNNPLLRYVERSFARIHDQQGTVSRLAKSNSFDVDPVDDNDDYRRRHLAAGRQNSQSAGYDEDQHADDVQEDEVVGLRWSDVDLDKGILYIRQTIGPLKGQILVKPPKSATSRRTVELKGGIVALLRAHKVRQAEKRLKLGNRWRDEDLVFCNDYGSAINPNNRVREFDRLVEKAGVPSLRIHDLRHTYATLALAAGENPKVVSESLGHSDVAITLRIYQHVLPSQRHNLADRMERLLLGAQQADLTG